MEFLKVNAFDSQIPLNHVIANSVFLYNYFFLVYRYNTLLIAIKVSIHNNHCLDYIIIIFFSCFAYITRLFITYKAKGKLMTDNIRLHAGVIFHMFCFPSHVAHLLCVINLLMKNYHLLCITGST